MNKPNLASFIVATALSATSCRPYNNGMPRLGLEFTEVDTLIQAAIAQGHIKEDQQRISLKCNEVLMGISSGDPALTDYDCTLNMEGRPGLNRVSTATYVVESANIGENSIRLEYEDQTGDGVWEIVRGSTGNSFGSRIIREEKRYEVQQEALKR